MMNREFKKLASDVQMSEAFITSMFLALSGGFQDAYTYFTRDEVFSNAQTGNVVLMSTHLMMGEWMQGIKYLFPLPVVYFLRSVFRQNTNMPRNFTGGREFCFWRF